MLKPASEAAVTAMLDGMVLFKMGFSWGGFESLIVPVKPGGHRASSPVAPGDVCLRMHVGLEHPQDLIADLAAGLERLSACRD